MKIFVLSLLFFCISLQPSKGVLIEKCHGLWVDFAELKNICKSDAGKYIVDHVRYWAELKFHKNFPTLDVVNSGIVEDSGSRSLGIWKISESEYFYTANLTKTAFYAVTHIGEITTSQHLAEEDGNKYLGQLSAFEEPIWEHELDWMNLSDASTPVIGKFRAAVQRSVSEAVTTQLNVQADQMKEITLIGVWRCDSFIERNTHRIVAIVKYDVSYYFVTVVYYNNIPLFVPMNVGQFHLNRFRCDLDLYTSLNSTITMFQKNH